MLTSARSLYSIVNQHNNNYNQNNNNNNNRLTTSVTVAPSLSTATNNLPSNKITYSISNDNLLVDIGKSIRFTYKSKTPININKKTFRVSIILLLYNKPLVTLPLFSKSQ